jgi:hypothetical protein
MVERRMLMKNAWLVSIVLIPMLILIGAGCKKSQDEVKEKVKVKAVRKEAYREVRDTVNAVKMEESGMARDTTVGTRK